MILYKSMILCLNFRINILGYVDHSSSCPLTYQVVTSSLLDTSWHQLTLHATKLFCRKDITIMKERNKEANKRLEVVLIKEITIFRESNSVVQSAVTYHV